MAVYGTFISKELQNLSLLLSGVNKVPGVAVLCCAGSWKHVNLS